MPLPGGYYRRSRCRSPSGSSSGSKTSLTVMLTSTTLKPVRLCTRLVTLRRTASESCELPTICVLGNRASGDEVFGNRVADNRSL